MMRIPLVLTVFVLAISGAARAEPPRLLPGQADTVPLRTTVSVAEQGRIAGLFRFDGFEKARVVELRRPLTGLAQAGDPLAQELLARTYDLFPFGQGDWVEAQRALYWYLRAAAQHHAGVEFLLYSIYSYGHLHVPPNSTRALEFLNRAYEHSAGALKAAVATEFARLTSTESGSGVPRNPGVAPDAERSLAYLEEALVLDPNDGTVLDWLFSRYLDAGKTTRALGLAERSRNSSVWQRAGEICLQQDQLDLPRAVWFLLHSAEAQRKEGTDGLANGALVKLYTLLCRKEVAKKDIAGVYSEATWKQFQQWQRNCVIDPGG